MGSPVQSGLARGKKRRRSSFGSRRSLSPRDASTQLSSNIWLESYWCGHPWRGLLPRPGKGKIDFCPPLSVCSFLLFFDNPVRSSLASVSLLASFGLYY
jgi:hypothetical protein